MERIKNCSGYQKVFLALAIAMIVIFTIIYPIVGSQVGFQYEGGFLEKRSENGDTVYSGWVKGKILTYTVTEDKTLTCRYGDNTYGPYTARKDPTADPKNNGRAEDMVGVEIRDGEQILFRGGVLLQDKDNMTMVLVDEKDGDPDYDITVSFGGVKYDSEGNIINPMKPTAYMILRLLAGPKLVRRGSFLAWLGGMLFSAITVVTILFAKELFYMRMSFRVRDAEHIEPSDWEIMTRHICWIASTIIALGIFISGLFP